MSLIPNAFSLCSLDQRQQCKYLQMRTYFGLLLKQSYYMASEELDFSMWVCTLFLYEILRCFLSFLELSRTSNSVYHFSLSLHSNEELRLSAYHIFLCVTEFILLIKMLHKDLSELVSWLVNQDLFSSKQKH